MNNTEDRPILCMQHCTNRTNIFFLKFPNTCPICGFSLRCCSLIIPPFRIPSPFSCQEDLSCVFVMKPTIGKFLRDYKSGDNLHVGIASSNRTVYSFDEQGLHADRDGWDQCIIVPVNEVHVLPEDWDSKLLEMYQSGLWTSMVYDEHNNNCFSFAISFLNQFVSNKVETGQKEDFCKKYIVPRTRNAARYIDLYRRVQERRGILTESNRMLVKGL